VLPLTHLQIKGGSVRVRGSCVRAVTAVLRQEELAFIKAVQRSDFPILSSAAEESSGGWQEEGPCGLQSYREECFGPRASEQSR